MFRKLSSLAIALGLLAVAAGCTKSSIDVRVDGSSTVYPITEAVAVKLRREHPGIRVTVAKSGTGGGMKKFGKGEIDICDASREMKEEESVACEQAGVRYDHFTVAYDGVAVCVHPENDWCNSLTVEQLKLLYILDSPIKTWKDLNEAWPAEEIKLFGPGADSGTFDTFKEEVLGKDAKVRTGYTQSEEDNVLVNGVKQDKYALGYFGYAYYAENTEALKVLAIDPGDGNPVAPSVESIRDKTYTPLSRPLMLYVNLDSFDRAKVADFVKFYLDNADQMAAKVKYVPVAEEIGVENAEKFEKLKSAAKPTADEV